MLLRSVEQDKEVWRGDSHGPPPPGLSRTRLDFNQTSHNIEQFSNKLLFEQYLAFT